jgi:RNA polymerase sigma factor (sigma-70 family)
VDAVAAWDDYEADAVVALNIATGFPEFYARTHDGLTRALALTLGDLDLGADAADEALARAYLRWDHVSTLDNPGGWAYRVGLNWGRSVLRKLRRPVIVTDPTTVEIPSIVEPALLDAVRRLSTRHRSVVVCRYLFGWSEDQTAQTLGLRPGTVRSCLHRALRRLATDGPDRHD